MCPLGGFLMDGHSRSLTGHLVCHCLLIETDRDGLVLIDTGFGMQDVARPSQRLSTLFRGLLRPALNEQDTALRQVERLGFSARDVRHIVLTHLDFDHAGGLDDFPEALVHLLSSEEQVASAQRSWLDRKRFRPQQWHTREQWCLYTPSGERWFDFEAVRPLTPLAEQVLLIPLAGHTLGHAGVAVRDGSRWLLHCGDAYFYRGEMHPDGYRCTPGLRLYQDLMEQHRELRLHNQQRLRALAEDQAAAVRLFCAHDPAELTQLQYEAQNRTLKATGPAPHTPTFRGSGTRSA